MQSDRIHEFFYVASRVVLVVPFVVIFIVLAIRYQVFNSNIEPVVKNLSSSKKVQNITTSSQIIKKEGMDLNKDVICSFFDKEASISAYKKENNIFVRNKTLKEISNYLINGDCLYKWKEGSSTGQKTCNIGRYVSIAQTLYSTGLIDIDTLMNYIPKDVSIASQNAFPLSKIKQVIQSCMNKKVEEKNMFNVPKEVRFKEGEK